MSRLRKLRQCINSRRGGLVVAGVFPLFGTLLALPGALAFIANTEGSSGLSVAAFCFFCVITSALVIPPYFCRARVVNRTYRVLWFFRGLTP